MHGNGIVFAIGGGGQNNFAPDKVKVDEPEKGPISYLIVR